jgi:hypothetical protein
VGADITGPEDEWVPLLTGADVVISSVHPTQLKNQTHLADAAKRAGAGRFIPCFFGTIAPPNGVMALRDVVRHYHPSFFDRMVV